MNRRTAQGLQRINHDCCPVKKLNDKLESLSRKSSNEIFGSREQFFSDQKFEHSATYFISDLLVVFAPLVKNRGWVEITIGKCWGW